MIDEAQISVLRDLKCRMVSELHKIEAERASLNALNKRDRKVRLAKLNTRKMEIQRSLSETNAQLKSANILNTITRAELEARLTQAVRLLGDARNILKIHDPSPALESVLIRITQFILDQGRWAKNSVGYNSEGES